MSVELACTYLDTWAPQDSNLPYFSKGDPMEVFNLLNVLYPLFSGDDQAPYRDAVYDEHYEEGADEVLIAAAAVDPMQIDIGSIELGRILYERYRQSLVVIGANASAKTTLLVPCTSLSLALRQSATVLLWLHEMKLPYHPGTVLARQSRIH